MAYRQDLPASLALSPERQAAVTALIQAVDLDDSEFMWMFQPNTYYPTGPLVSGIVHTPTGYSFRFEFLDTTVGRNRVSVFSSQSRPNGRSTAASWVDQLEQVREWLKRLGDATK